MWEFFVFLFLGIYVLARCMNESVNSSLSSQWKDSEERRDWEFEKEGRYNKERMEEIRRYAYSVKNIENVVQDVEDDLKYIAGENWRDHIFWLSNESRYEIYPKGKVKDNVKRIESTGVKYVEIKENESLEKRTDDIRYLAYKILASREGLLRNHDIKANIDDDKRLEEHLPFFYRFLQVLEKNLQKSGLDVRYYILSESLELWPMSDEFKLYKKFKKIGERGLKLDCFIPKERIHWYKRLWYDNGTFIYGLFDRK